MQTIAFKGVCVPNPGGAIGIAVAGAADRILVVKGRAPEQDHTAQLAELMALGAALALIDPTEAPAHEIVSDSDYAINCIVRWSPRWAKSAWRRPTSEPIRHEPLIRT